MKLEQKITFPQIINNIQRFKVMHITPTQKEL